MCNPSVNHPFPNSFAPGNPHPGHVSSSCSPFLPCSSSPACTIAFQRSRPTTLPVSPYSLAISKILSAYLLLLAHVMYARSCFGSFHSFVACANAGPKPPSAVSCGSGTLIGGGVISTTLVLPRSSCVRMSSTKARMLSENCARGTYSPSPTKQASFAPRKMVKSKVLGAEGEVSWEMRCVNSGLIRSEVYLSL